MRITTAVGHEYLKYWIEGLEQLLGWDRTRVMTWAIQYEWQLNDEDSLFFHEEPLLYMSFLLVPDGVKPQLSAQERVRLAGRIAGAIWQPRSAISDDTKHDWAAAASRVDAVLHEYGESLSNVRRQYDH